MVTHMTPDKTDKGGYITAAAYEGDIVSRLRNWRGLHLAHGGKLFDEAADEIERLRSQPCPYVTGRVTKYCTLSSPTLTDAEREAVDRARIAFRDMDHNAMTMQQIEDYESLCVLLERLA